MERPLFCTQWELRRHPARERKVYHSHTTNVEDYIVANMGNTNIKFLKAVLASDCEYA